MTHNKNFLRNILLGGFHRNHTFVPGNSLEHPFKNHFLTHFEQRQMNYTLHLQGQQILLKVESVTDELTSFKLVDEKVLIDHYESESDTATLVDTDESQSTQHLLNVVTFVPETQFENTNESDDDDVVAKLMQRCKRRREAEETSMFPSPGKKKDCLMCSEDFPEMLLQQCPYCVWRMCRYCFCKHFNNPNRKCPHCRG